METLKYAGLIIVFCAILIGGVACQVHDWKVCRDLGYSWMHCARQISK